ncbi:efflux RND transporter permease subunit [Paraglaciecola aquimarina]|uniref:Efflux RND transporter permease subunit n=1 Tax=Paraglaciecola algarum TaxID=3050085 RepID=A0ABS9DFF5_9ALTE|nr:efflux RND transporter permease subunit [Paraglaciecola sp. G1-23]
MFKSVINKGTLVAVVVSIICVLGIVGSLKIPVQMIPDLEVRTISVRTGWSGATPQDVEKEILIEQERYLRSIPNLKRMTSYASMGSASIELEFPFGVEVNDAMINVNNALSQVSSYPENVDQPRLISSSFSSNAFLYYSLKPQSGNPLGLDMDLILDYAEDYVRPQMESVSGVSEVRVSGGAARQIQIKVDPSRLAQRGISITNIRNAIRNRNKDASAGDIETQKERYLIRVLGRFDNVSDLENLIIQRKDNINIYLKDVAEVVLDHYETRGLSYFDGERTIRLSVRRESGSNVIDIKDQMLKVVERINSDLLQHNGLELVLTSDDVKYVKSSLFNVWVNLLLGGLLATLVMYYFLRSAKVTLIGVLGIPMCTIAAFMALLLFERTINVISLAGVAFAIGMTVDNTIVVLESIMQAKKRAKSSFEAAIIGVTDVWPAVLASTATTILVFAPILFVQQEAGQLYSDIAIAISGAIIASMLVAIFVVPVTLANFTKNPNKNSDKPAKEQIQLSNKWLKFVDIFIQTKSRALTTVATFSIITLGLAYILMPAAEYLPEGEEPKAFSNMIAPPSYNLTEMERIGAEIRTYLDDFVHDSSERFANGKTDMPPLAYYMMSVSAGRIWVLSSPEDANYIHNMMDALTTKFESYEGMRAFSSRGSIISSNDGGTRAVAVDISGPNLVELYQAAEAVYEQAKVIFDNPQINSQPSSLSLNQPLIEVKPRWDRLAELGLSNSELGYSISAFSDGAYVDEFILDDDKVDIFIFSHAGNKQNIEQLTNSPIITPIGQVMPLSALADMQASYSSDSLRRVDGNRTVSVYIIPPRNVALEIAEQKVRTELLTELLQKGKVAQGINLTISGAADQLEATKTSLSSNFVISIVLSYLLLVAIFTHWRYPLFILTTIPLGMAGGLLGLISVNGINAVLTQIGLPAFHQPLDMITMLGFLILLGTVVNNPILIVDQTRKNMLQGATDVTTAVRAAVEKRLMPILMSTSTTVFGLAPLVLIAGDGTELYRGVGIIVLCGIIFSTLLSLTFLPALLVSVLKTQLKPLNGVLSENNPLNTPKGV